MYPKISVVMQGPVYPETQEFADRYSRFESVAEVLVSCWEGCPGLQNVDQIFNKKPDIVGLGNRNLQIVSSYEGVRRTNCNYVLKVRTDMFLPELEELIDFYFKFSGESESSQIFTLSMYPRFPFHPRDHVFFGSSYNMSKLFYISIDRTPKVVYDEFTDVRSESYIGMWYYRQFNKKEMTAIINSPLEFLPDNAPRRKEALKLYHEFMISRKGFVPFPRTKVEWPRRYPGPYPYEFLKGLYGEMYHDDLMEAMNKF